MQSDMHVQCFVSMRFIVVRMKINDFARITQLNANCHITPQSVPALISLLLLLLPFYFRMEIESVSWILKFLNEDMHNNAVG
jgi:hypothetical protein